jgi:hypothetical protein
MVALILVVLFGFVGLALDGGRGYLDRRGVQASVDAAALAAAYNWMNSSDYTMAEQAATTMYANNQRLYMAPTCSGYGSLNVTCSFGDPTNQVLTITVANYSIAGVTFTATATHQVPVTIMQVMGIGPTMNIGAIATAIARHSPTSGAAIQTLDPASCNGTGNALVFTGTSTTLLHGDIWSNGSIVDNGTAGGTVSGNVVDICPSTPPLPAPNWTVSGTQENGFPLPDPDYPMPPINSTPQAWSSTSGSTELPGTYSANPRLTGGAGCYFLSAGVYDFSAGFTQNGGFISNELRPPDEPELASAGVPNTTVTTAGYNNQTSLDVAALPGPIPAGSTLNAGGQTLTVSANAGAGDKSISVAAAAVAIPNGSFVSVRSPNQFWDTNGTGCGSTFSLSSPGTGSFSGGTYSVELTALNWAPNGVASCSGPASPTCYKRESAPSMCKTLNLATSGNLKVDVTPDPGAQDFNVYVAANGSCSGLALCTNAGNGNGTVTINSCPSGQPAPPDVQAMPVAAGLPNSNPTPAAPPHGDLANEKQCVDPTTGSDVACASSWTPGAVVVFIPGPGSNQQCLNLQGGGDVYLFSGYQYNRVLLYEPGPEQTPPPNTCLNNVAGHGLTSLVGILYLPAASVTIIGNSNYLATIAGGIICWSATVKGTGGVAITADPLLRTFPPVVALTQ